jgi:hypothetical protein
MGTTTDNGCIIMALDRASFQLQELSFLIVTTTFCQWWNKSLHAALTKICRVTQNVACLSHHCRHCRNAPPTTSMCFYSLFGPINVQQASININGCNVFNRRNSMTHSSFVCTSKSDVILQDCSSAAVTRQQTLQITGGKVQSLLPYHHHPTLTFWANIIK